MADTDELIRDYFLKAKKGDREAFEYIYKEYFTPIYRYVFSRVKSRADTDDLVQDVFLKAYKSIGRFNLTAVSPLAYFYTIARNVIIDWQRKKRDVVTDEQILDTVPGDDSLDPGKIVIREEQKKVISEALPQLTDGVREVIEMKFLQEFTTQEIAEKLGKTEGAVRQLQMRGLDALREILKKDGYQ